MWPSVLLGLVAVGWLYWLVTWWGAARLLCDVPRVTELSPPEPSVWPRLSIILPACNEAAGIDAALRDRLREDYPAVQIIVVEDRSTDDTPAIVDRIAAGDSRMVVQHLTSLPSGWLGKTHAMQRGAELATGDWLLFSDADVHVEPGVMRKALAYCEQHGIEFLAILPDLWPNGFALDTALSTFARSFSMVCRLWSVPDPKKKAFVGIGAFNLVRRTALDRVGGFEALRLCVVDDMGLGQRLKRAGVRCAVMNGCGVVGVHFYRSYREMMHGTEKSVLVVNGFSLTRVLAGSLSFAWLECAPFVGVIAALPPWARWTSAGVCVLAMAQALTVGRWLKRPWWSCVLVPIGVLLTTISGIRAGVLAAWRGGIVWRGTLYTNAELRKQPQVTLP